MARVNCNVDVACGLFLSVCVSVLLLRARTCGRVCEATSLSFGTTQPQLCDAVHEAPVRRSPPRSNHPRYMRVRNSEFTWPMKPQCTVWCITGDVACITGDVAKSMLLMLCC